jgi:hypothetical protein
MERKVCGFVFVAVVLSILAPKCWGQDTVGQVVKGQERYILSLELEFTKKNENPLDRTISLLFGADPNAYATGFLVGDGLAMTAYHVVSGDLSDSKKMVLGFKPDDQLEVKVYVKGCKATVIKVDKDADLALLEVCGSQKQTKAPAFQTALIENEKLFVIARPHGDKMVSRGVFYGPYTFRGQQYWSAKIESRDGYSGSPVYNQKAEVVGVFTGYDWPKKLAVISPGMRAQKLLEDYMSSPKP